MIKVAVVGFGFMGRTHSLNILKSKDLEFVAIVDNNPALFDNSLTDRGGNLNTGDLSADDLAKVNKYSNLDDCLKSENVDVVNICVHSNLHYEMTKKALLHDKHVFLEKPFCLDIEQGVELINLAERRNKILMVGHVVRFMSPYQMLKKWIDSKEYGELKFLSLSRFCGIPGWGQWKEKDAEITAGGALFDLVIHDIDFAQSILGSPEEIQSFNLAGEYSANDYVSALWKFGERELNVKIEGGFTFHKSFPFQAGYMAQFEKKSILYNSLSGNVIKMADDTGVEELACGDPALGYYSEIEYFVKCVINGTPPLKCMPASSLQSVKLCYNHI